MSWLAAKQYRHRLYCLLYYHLTISPDSHLRTDHNWSKLSTARRQGPVFSPGDGSGTFSQTLSRLSASLSNGDYDSFPSK